MMNSPKTSGNTDAVRDPQVRIGLFARYFGWFPHPSQLGGASLDTSEVERISAYICASPLFSPLEWPGCVESAPIIGDSPTLLDDSFRCDGRWVFPASLAYYVRQGIRLPDAFLDHVRSRSYQPLGVQYYMPRPRSDHGWYWTYWSLVHTRPRPLPILHAVRTILFLPLGWLLYLFREPLRRRFSIE